MLPASFYPWIITSLFVALPSSFTPIRPNEDDMRLN
jgi:hypothetical protein